MKTTRRIDYIEKRITDFHGMPVEEEFSHTNDIFIDFVPGTNLKDIVFDTAGDAVKNVVEAVVNTVRGEMSLNKREGIPYFESVLGGVGGGDLTDWAGYMQNAISNTNGVSGIRSFEYSVQPIGRNRRSLVYSVTVNTAYGSETITNGIQKTEIKKIKYNNLGR